MLPEQFGSQKLVSKPCRLRNYAWPTWVFWTLTESQSSYLSRIRGSPSPITAASPHMHITNTANRNTISAHHSQSKLFFRAVIEQKLWSWLVFRSRWGCGWGLSKPVLEGNAKELRKRTSLNQHLPDLWSWKCHTPKLLWFSLCTILNCETVKKLRLSGLWVAPPRPPLI